MGRGRWFWTADITRGVAPDEHEGVRVDGGGACNKKKLYIVVVISDILAIQAQLTEYTSQLLPFSFISMRPRQLRRAPVTRATLWSLAQVYIL